MNAVIFSLENHHQFARFPVPNAPKMIGAAAPVAAVPGMWLDVITYRGNLASMPEQERFFARSYLECVVHYKDRIVFGVFVARFLGEETATPVSDTHRFFLLAHTERLRFVGISLTGRLLQFWGRYQNTATRGEHVRFLTLTDTWEC